MRLILLTLLALAVGTASAPGQTPSRFEFGPTLRTDRIFVEAGGSGNTAVFGAAAGWRFTRTYGIEAEITSSSSRVERSYEGWFISYVEGPNATRDEIERLAPVARRTLGYEPGLGGAVAFVARGELTPRVGLSGRVGVSGRRYVETSDYTVLQIPEGVSPDRVARDFLDTSNTHSRGGLLLGVDVPVRLTARLQVVPEVRYVYGGPARVGNKHRELGVGVRGVWGF